MNPVQNTNYPPLPPLTPKPAEAPPVPAEAAVMRPGGVPTLALAPPCAPATPMPATPKRRPSQAWLPSAAAFPVALAQVAGALEVGRVYSIAPRGDLLACTAVAGRGKFGTVYEVESVATGEPLALKILRRPPDMTTGRWHDEIHTEIALLRQCQGPGVIGLEADVVSEDYACILMELAQKDAARFPGDGPSLRDEAQRLGMRGDTMHPLLVLHRLRDIFTALVTVHGRGIVHRDVQPHNFVMTRGGLKLTDFGLAVSAEVHDRRAVGTINFMAPEVLRGEGATPASDVFSAGCLAQYMITGYEPYYGEEIDEIREALLAGTPLHPAEEVDLYLEALFPREVSPESRRALVDLIRDATDPDPTARPLAAALLRRLDTLRIARPRALSVRRGEEVEPSPTRAFFATGI